MSNEQQKKYVEDDYHFILECGKYNYYIVIHIFLLISMENNRAIYPCICRLCIKCILH